MLCARERAGFVCEGSTGMGAGVGLGVGEGMVASAGAGVGMGEGGGCDRTKAGKERNVKSGTDMLRACATTGYKV